MSSTKFALLRGINVGGHRKVPMAELRQLMTDLGFGQVKTYIQSGNIIFNADTEETAQLAEKIQKAILEHFGFEVPVICLTAETLQQAVKNNPFATEATPLTQLHLSFLNKVPEKSLAEALQEIDLSPDQFHLQNTFIYLNIPGKYHKTKLSNALFEKKLKVSATTRNWKTVMKLITLSE